MSNGDVCPKLTVQDLSLGPSWSSRAQGWPWPSRWCGPVNSCHPSVAWSAAHARLQVHPPSAPCLVQLIVLSKQDFLEGGGRSALRREPHLTGPGLRARRWEGLQPAAGLSGPHTSILREAGLQGWPSAVSGTGLWGFPVPKRPV